MCGGDAGAHAHGRNLRGVGGRECAPDALRESIGVGVGAVVAGQQDDELLAPDTRDGVDVSRVARQHRAQTGENAVAGLVTPFVVDAFEVVDVERGECDGSTLAPGVCQLDRGTLLEAAPVEQTCELVDPRLPGETRDQLVVAARKHMDDRGNHHGDHDVDPAKKPLSAGKDSSAMP